jgi:hypothetical protein
VRDGISVIELMKAAAARREAIHAYRRAMAQLKVEEHELRRLGFIERAEKVHGYYNAALMAEWMERNDPPLRGIGL